MLVMLLPVMKMLTDADYRASNTAALTHSAYHPKTNSQ